MVNAGESAAMTNGKDADRASADADALFAGPGEVRALARTLDWGATPLGWPNTWSRALRIATRAMLDARHPICLWSGPEYALVYNDAYRGILSAKHPAALGRPGAVVWAEIWAGIEPQFAQVWQGGAPVYGEDARFVMARLEGGATEEAWFSYSLSALRDEDGRVVAVLNISPETTARVHAERALAAERERLRGVILQAPVPMALHEGPEHRYVLVNAAYKRVSGGRDVTGLTLREAFPDVAGQGVYEVFDGVYATGEPWAGPETHLHYDRRGTGPEDAWFDLRYDPVRDAHGRVTGILNFSVDVTDQVLARREVEGLLAREQRARAAAEESSRVAEAARAEAQAANQAKSQFLATMSHELRTPLNAIGGYAELIELGIHGPVTEAQRTALARVQASQRHLLGLISGVLDYSRVEAGAVTYRIVDVPVAEAIAEAESLVAPQLRAKGLGYVWSGTAAGLRVRADREKLQQVLLNLLGNAIKFTHARDGAPGLIEVACTVDSRVEEAVDGDPEGSHVRIHVRDTGEGIAAHTLDLIFEPFVQADQRLTRPHAGVGLGLAISRDLARGMGGDLTVESTPGVGSTFTLTLPRA